MLHPRDLLGKYVNYAMDPGGSSSSRGLVNGLLPDQTTKMSVAIYEGGEPKAAADTHRVWTFTFLKYCPGFITFTPLVEGAVLTGPMSGCYLCKYNRLGQKLAHIGTAHSMTSQESVNAKQAWLSFVGRPDVTGVTGGNPFDFFDLGEIKATMLAGAPIPDIAGYFASGEAFAMLLARVPMNQNPLGARLTKVAAYKKMTLQPWSSIAAMRRFQV
jgi:hypothetical protein